MKTENEIETFEEILKGVPTRSITNNKGEKEYFISPANVLNAFGLWEMQFKPKSLVPFLVTEIKVVEDFLIEACDLMDFCIDRGYLDNEDLTDGQKSFNEARENLNKWMRDKLQSTEEPKVDPVLFAEWLGKSTFIQSVTVRGRWYDSLTVVAKYYSTTELLSIYKETLKK